MAQNKSDKAREYAKEMQRGAKAPPIDVPAESTALATPQAQGTALARAGLGFVESLGVQPERLAAEDAMALLAGLKDEFEVSAGFVKIEPGMIMRGCLVGESAVDITDPDGHTKRVRTWILEDDNGVRAQILSAHQLESEFCDKDGRCTKIGRDVVIMRLEDERTGKGRMVSRYTIGFRREGAAGVTR